jgi:hypothetical protein
MKIPAYSYLFIIAFGCMLPAALYFIYRFVICMWQRFCEIYAEAGIAGVVAILGAIGIVLFIIGGMIASNEDNLFD